VCIHCLLLQVCIDCNLPPPHKVAAEATSLRETATHCNTLQHTAPHCNTLQHEILPPTKSRQKQSLFRLLRILQHTAPHCNTLQHEISLSSLTHTYRQPPLPGSAFQCVSVLQCYSVLQRDDQAYLPPSSSSLQYVEMCCSKLQHVAECCSVLTVHTCR